MLVGEAPGYEEDRQGEPLVGEAGRLLNHVLERLGVDRGELYITNVIKCRPRDNVLPGKKELRECCFQCIPYLSEEIETVRPKAVVLLGGTALSACTDETGITKHEGMIVKVKDGVSFVAAFHPAYVLRSPGKEIRLAQALHRAFGIAGIKTHITKGPIYAYDIRS
jgi:DNA polymerase